MPFSFFLLLWSVTVQTFPENVAAFAFFLLGYLGVFSSGVFAVCVGVQVLRFLLRG
jgi:hypothetical protein